MACAPQFHENHLFGATLAFNLLLGRAWPPSFDDVSAAIRLCRELGLRDLLERMPAGIFEMVGETGWQLSHGERCRVYLARALLQRASSVETLSTSSKGAAMKVKTTVKAGKTRHD